MRKSLIVVAVIGLAALGSWLGSMALKSPALAKGPMVQLTAEHAFSVVWAIAPGSKNTARVLKSDGSILQPVRVIEEEPGRFVAFFDGLKPGQRCRYQILADGRPIAEHVTKPAPPPGASLRILAFGDSGTGERPQYRLAGHMTEHEPDLVLHTGDLICMDGEREDYLLKFYRPYAALIARVPFYPVMGNHDYLTDRGQPMFDEFVLPDNGPEGETPERHYWFDFGGVRFVAIDTNLPKETLQETVAPWLDRVLADAAGLWKVVFFHHPVYTNGKYGPAYRLWDTILPVMEAHGVNLVLCGHDHLYERTHPVRNQEVVAPGEGIVHVTTGAGGSDLYAINPEPMEQMAVQYNAKHGFTLIDVSPGEMKLRHLNVDGDVIDEFTIPRPAASPVAESPNTG